MRISLYWKLILGFGLIILAMILVHGYILLNLNSVYTSFTTSFAGDVAAIEDAQRLHDFLNAEETYAQKYLISGDQVYSRLFRDARAQTLPRMDSLATVLVGREEKRVFRQVRSIHDWLQMTVHSPSLRYTVRSSQITDSMDVAHAGLDQLVHLNQAAIGRVLAQVERNTTQAFRVGIFLVLGALLATILVAFIITHAISAPLNELRQSTERIARGDYHTIPVRSSDEIGMVLHAFNTMSTRLKKIDEYKAEVMQQISHELRTPLQSMHAAYYMLAEQIAGPLNERQRSLLTTIRDNVDALSTFSNQFLDLAKIEAGMMEFHPRSIDLLSVITPVINNARLIASQKEINIGLAAQSVPNVQADPEKVAMVLSNLLSNAIKFTQKGGHITVSIGPCEGGARIAVKDSGVGIDPEDLPKLFTKFFQARNVSQINVKGTGVGLALVKAIVDGHGGKVYANSTVGQGSTFTVELPAFAGRS